MESKRLRTLSVIATAALLVGAATAGTADAKKKKPKGCPAYVPSQWSTDVPITTVTDAHTADAPLVLDVPTEAGVGTSDSGDPANQSQTNPVSHVYLNVQVDTAAAETGLYGTLEFTPVWDYDLYFRNNDGIGLAYSAGFAEGVPLLDGTGHGGHTGVGSENIEGLTTPDCTGYLVDIVSATTPGEEVTLSLWTGEATYVPE